MNKKLKKKKLGMPSSITPQFPRAITKSQVRAPAERVTAYTLVSTYQPLVGICHVQQLMQEADHLRWCRVRSAPRSTDEHKSSRVDWAKQQLHRSASKWMRTIFSDEKRFYLDGPYGAA